MRRTRKRAREGGTRGVGEKVEAEGGRERKVGLVDRKLHVLPSHKFSVGAAAWGCRRVPVVRRRAFRLAAFRRDKRPLLITPRVLDARLIAGITGINARVRRQTRGMFVLRNERTSGAARKRGGGRRKSELGLVINFDNGKISLRGRVSGETDVIFLPSIPYHARTGLRLSESGEQEEGR